MAKVWENQEQCLEKGNRLVPGAGPVSGVPGAKDTAGEKGKYPTHLWYSLTILIDTEKLEM